jgi:hypothetical protein
MWTAPAERMKGGRWRAGCQAAPNTRAGLPPFFVRVWEELRSWGPGLMFRRHRWFRESYAIQPGRVPVLRVPTPLYGLPPRARRVPSSLSKARGSTNRVSEQFTILKYEISPGLPGYEPYKTIGQLRADTRGRASEAREKRSTIMTRSKSFAGHSELMTIRRWPQLLEAWCVSAMSRRDTSWPSGLNLAN